MGKKVNKPKIMYNYRDSTNLGTPININIQLYAA